MPRVSIVHNNYRPFDRHQSFKLTPEQIKVLEEVFSCISKPAMTIKRELSVRLTLPLETVSSWFNSRKRTVLRVQPKATTSPQPRLSSEESNVSSTPSLGLSPQSPPLPLLSLPCTIPSTTITTPSISLAEATTIASPDIYSNPSCVLPKITLPDLCAIPRSSNFSRTDPALYKLN